MKNRILLQEINRLLETKIDPFFRFVLSRKSKIHFNFQFCISNIKLKIDRAEREQELTQEG